MLELKLLELEEEEELSLEPLLKLELELDAAEDEGKLNLEPTLELPVELDALAGTKALMFAEVELALEGKKTALAIAEVELDAPNPAPTELPTEE